MRKPNAKPTVTTFKNGYRCSGTAVLVNGSSERFQATAKTEKEALVKWQKKVDERNYEIAYGEKKKNGDITLYDACKDMISDWENGVARELPKEDKLLSDSSIKRLRVTLEHQIKPTEISKMLVKDIMPVDCDNWRNEINRMKSNRGKLLSASTKQRAFALIDDTLDYYRHAENPMRFANKRGWHQTANTKTKNNVLTPDEILKVENYCNAKMIVPKTRLDAIYAGMTLVMIYCYMRPGELYALQCRDYDAENKTLTIQRTGKHEDGRTKTAGSQRTIYIVKQAADILNKRCESRKATERIFPSLSGGIISDSAYRAWLLKMLKELEIEKENFSPHKLRGTGISYAVYNKMPIDITSENAGHSDIATTLKWYKQTYGEAKKEAVAAYEKALSERPAL